MRKNSVSGARYTKVGIVCMKSSTGLTKRLNRSLSPAQTPSGMPTASDSTTAASVSASVSMLSCHRPSSPKETKPARVSSATLRFPYSHATAVATPTTPSHPTTGTGRPKDGRLISAWMNLTNSSMKSLM